MIFRSLLAPAVLLLSTVISSGNAQGTFAYFTDNSTGIKFWQNTIPDGESTSGGFQFGIALPPNGTGSNTEYIGRIQGALHNGTLRQGWSGISHGGEMTESLLLLAWPDPSGNNSIKTSFRAATDYVAPSIYTGNATVTPISQTVTDTSFTLIYRCQNCFAWTINGTSASQIPSQQEAAVVLGWVQAFAAPSDPSSSTASIKFHDNGYGEFGVVVSNATNPSYSQWAALATGSSGGASSTAVAAAATSDVGGSDPSGFSFPGALPTGGFGGGFGGGGFPGFPSGFQTIPLPAGTGSPFDSIFGQHKHHKPGGVHRRIQPGTGAPFPFATATGAHHPHGTGHHHHHHPHGTGVEPSPMGGATGAFKRAAPTGSFPSLVPSGPFPFPTGSGIAPPPVGGPFPSGAVPTGFREASSIGSEGDQCGGAGYEGSRQCAEGLVCHYVNAYLSECQ